MKEITPSWEYEVSSMTWHQWHQTAERERRMGLPPSLASPKASAPHSRQRMSAARLGREGEPIALDLRCNPWGSLGSGVRLYRARSGQRGHLRRHIHALEYTARRRRL